MIFLLELLVGSIRVMLFYTGAIFTFVLGEQLYREINTTLFLFSIPCIEILSLIAAIASPIAYFFGIHHQKSFFQRESKYNKGIFLVTFLFGIGVAFSPIGGSPSDGVSCAAQVSMMSKIFQAIITGAIAAFTAYISFAVGVFQARHLTPRLQKSKKPSKEKKVRKK